MPDAFIYDAIRTPRGRGKVDGSLHEVTALNLASQALAAIKDRNKLDPALVDDVVLGCVDPVGEAGGDIARAAALVAGFGDGVPGVQINRFCASGLDAVNFAAAEVMSGQHEMTIGGGAELMSRVGIGASGGAWPVDPVDRGCDLFPAARYFRRSDRDEVRVLARRRRCLCGRKPEARCQVLGRRPFQEFGRAGEGRQWHSRYSPRTSTCGRARRCRRWPRCKPSFVQMGEMAGFDAVAVQRYPEVEAVNHVHTPGNSSGIVDGAAAVLIGSKAAGKPRA